jgi:RNA polymerase sigma factor (sigma-70 family)
LGELRVALGRELARLSVEQRQALSLRVVEEWPYPEIAALLGVSEDTVRARVSRGLRKLTQALEQHQATAERTS